MRKIAFIDAKEQPLLYLFEKSGSTYTHKETIRASHTERGEISFESRPEGADALYVSLPPSMLSFRIVEFPFSDMKRIREVLPFELDTLMLGGSGGMVFDARILAERPGACTVLVVGIERDTLGRLLDSLAGLKAEVGAVTSLEVAAALATSSPEMNVAHLLIRQGQETVAGEDRTVTAIKELSSPSMNLWRGERARPGSNKLVRQSLTVTALFSALLVSLFLAHTSLEIIGTGKTSAAIKKQLHDEYRNLFPREKEAANELYRLKAHLKEVRDKEHLFVGIAPLQLLLELSSLSGPNRTFNELTVDRDRIIIKGEASSLEEVQQVKTGVERLLLGTDISEVKPSSQGKTAFTITAKGRKR